jgi:23S rRNA pseudouridine955/2504/2580 synthase
VLRRFVEASLVEATLETGRTHQIRVHAAAHGTPILGDSKYGDAEINRRFRAIGLRRLFLHAARLRIPMPRETGCLTVEAPLAHELTQLVETLDD